MALSGVKGMSMCSIEFLTVMIPELANGTMVLFSNYDERFTSVYILQDQKRRGY